MSNVALVTMATTTVVRLIYDCYYSLQLYKTLEEYILCNNGQRTLVKPEKGRQFLFFTQAYSHKSSKL